MNQKKIKSTISVILAAVAFLVAPAELRAKDDDERAYPFEFYQYGFSGNVATLVAPSATPIPAIGARGTYAGNDRGLIGRIQASGMAGGVKDSHTAVIIGSARLRGALGVLETNGVTYSAIGLGSYDGAGGNRGRHAAILIVGGELGKRLVGGDQNILIVGVHSGIGLGWGIQGAQVVQEPGMEPLGSHSFDRAALALGGSVLGKIGKDGQAGAVLFDGSGSALLGQGLVADVAIDVNVSEHIQLGAGVNVARLHEDETNGDVNVVQPYVRLTLSEHSAKDKTPPAPRKSYDDYGW